MLALTDTGWEHLNFWKGVRWEIIQDKLDDLTSRGFLYNPSRKNLFRSLQLCPLDKTKVVILGQDPYPNPAHATGVAFSIPCGIKSHPPTLRNILREYSDDLGLDYPESGCLEAWCEEGVLLWNSIPSCLSYRSLSHEDWSDWSFLTEEIIETVSKNNVVFILMGRRAELYRQYIDEYASDVIVTPHPSPRARGFRGSRVFSTANMLLIENQKEAVDWRLNGKE